MLLRVEKPPVAMCFSACGGRAVHLMDAPPRGPSEIQDSDAFRIKTTGRGSSKREIERFWYLALEVSTPFFAVRKKLDFLGLGRAQENLISYFFCLGFHGFPELVPEMNHRNESPQPFGGARP